MVVVRAATRNKQQTINLLCKLQRSSLCIHRQVLADDLTDNMLGLGHISNLQTALGREIKTELLRVHQRAL